MRAKEHLPRVQLGKDARHGPDVTLHVPLLAVQDDLRRTILTRVHYLSVVLLLIGRATEINQFNFDNFWAIPHTLRGFQWLKSGVIITGVFVAFLWAIDLKLVLDLQGPEGSIEWIN